MPKTRPPYAAEFRQQMVDLVRSGRAPEDLAREFEPSSQAIRTWVAQLMHPLILQASDHAENLSIHPLFHEHVSERLHQRTNPVLGPIGEVFV